MGVPNLKINKGRLGLFKEDYMRDLDRSLEVLHNNLILL
jgi:hypothetical protein